MCRNAAVNMALLWGLLLAASLVCVSKCDECPISIRSSVSTGAGNPTQVDLRCTDPTLVWELPRSDLHLDLSWSESNEDFRLCFVKATHTKVLVRGVAQEMFSLLSTEVKPLDQQACFTSTNRQLKLVMQVAAEHRQVGIQMHVKPLLVQDQQPRSGPEATCRKQFVMQGQRPEIRLQCNGLVTLDWQGRNVGTATLTLHGPPTSDTNGFRVCLLPGSTPFQVFKSNTNQNPHVVGSTGNNNGAKQCFDTTSAALYLTLSKQPNIANIPITVEVTGKQGTTTTKNCQMETNAGAKALETVISCERTTIVLNEVKDEDLINMRFTSNYGDFDLCFVKASVPLSIEYDNDRRNLPFEERQDNSRCIGSTDGALQVLMKAYSTQTRTELTVKRKSSSQASAPALCSLTYNGVKSFKNSMKCQHSNFKWLNAAGSLDGEVHWMDASSPFVICFTQFQFPLTLRITGSREYTSEDHTRGFCEVALDRSLRFQLTPANTHPSLAMSVQMQPCNDVADCDRRRNEMAASAGVRSKSNTPLRPQSEGTDMTATIIILIVLGVALLLLIIAIIIIAVNRRKRRKEKANIEENGTANTAK